VIIYLAGAETLWRQLIDIKPHAILCSFYALRKMKDDLENIWEALGKPKIFLDSGGFTFINQNKSIEENYLEDYAEFVKQYNDIIEVYANIDVNNAEQTLIHQRRLEELGINPAPVWHVGESEELLKYYIFKYDYVLIGGIVVKARQRGHEKIDSIVNQTINWINNLLQIYKENVKIHLFGVTRNFEMFNKKVYSVDSTAWMSARWGEVAILHGNKIKSLSWKQLNHCIFTYAEKYNIPLEIAEKVMHGNTYAMMEWNAYIWKALQEIYHPDFKKSEQLMKIHEAFNKQKKLIHYT